MPEKSEPEKSENDRKAGRVLEFRKSAPAEQLGESEAEDTAPRTYFIVGLGNPGSRYDQTPHNLGFMALDRLAERNRIPIRNQVGFSTIGSGRIGNKNVILAKPQTFMNRSGSGIRQVMEDRKLTSRDLILVYDDIDLPWTALRIKKKGSAGGHNGVKSVISELRTDWFARVRMGAHPDGEIEDAAQYVLAPMGRDMKEGLDELLTYTAEAIESIVADGALRAMTKFNRRAKGLKDEEE